jgi:hypothetical protein
MWVHMCDGFVFESDLRSETQPATNVDRSRYPASRYFRFCRRSRCTAGELIVVVSVPAMQPSSHARGPDREL